MTDKDLAAQQQARDAVEAASLAFASVSKLSQDAVDSICEAMSRAALAEAGRLGQLANTETGFGKAEDKREKNRFAAEDLWNFIRGMKTVGVLRDSESVVEIASPRGVVAAIIPSTNPTSTTIYKILISVKARNTIVLSPHPSAAECIAETARIMRDAGVRAGLPADAIICLTNSTIEGTEALMKHRKTAVILATGGTGLVRAAYSSGKPAFGVGPGNVPVFIERSANVAKAVSDILSSTCFDNGTICASEQSIVADAPVAAAVREQFARQGGHFLNQAEADAVAKVLLTSQRTLNPNIVGKSAAFIANLAGVSIPDGKRCLIADCGGVGRDFPWSVEKLSPTLAFFTADGARQGATLCRQILEFGGMGHTAGIHTQDRAIAVEFGSLMPAARIIINSPTTHGAIGFTTDLSPSMTLGCGSWGGNVTSDNISPLHLIDVKRVAFETKPLANRAERETRAAVQDGASQERDRPKRQQIAALVDRFLSERLATEPVQSPKPTPADQPAFSSTPTAGAYAPRAVVHEITPEKSVQKPAPVATADFVSEDDVRRALNRGEKIFISKTTILTPSARDLGEEREVFARV